MKRTLPAALLLILFLAGCTPTPKVEIPLGKALFQFDHETTGELMISKNDAASGDRWTARLVRISDEKLSRSSLWQIASAPEGRVLSDRLADEKFIAHFLDTLRTFRAEAMADKGPLNSFGLAPAQWAIRWNTPNHGFEVRLGNETKSGDRYAYVPDPDSDPFVGAGATNKMLEYLSSFDQLRHRVLLTRPGDDFDEVSLWRNGRQSFRALREPEKWVDQKHRPLRQDVDRLIEDIAHLRADKIVDDPATLKRLLPLLEKKPQYQAILKDRRDQPTRIAAVEKDKKLWGWISSREQAVFELYPEAIRLFNISKY